MDRFNYELLNFMSGSKNPDFLGIISINQSKNSNISQLCKSKGIINNDQIVVGYGFEFQEGEIKDTYYFHCKILIANATSYENFSNGLQETGGRADLTERRFPINWNEFTGLMKNMNFMVYPPVTQQIRALSLTDGGRAK